MFGKFYKIQALLTNIGTTTFNLTNRNENTVITLISLLTEKYSRKYPYTINVISYKSCLY